MSALQISQWLPALKMGVGESSRSHTADEYVLTSEILKEGQTSAKITSSGGASFDFTITVRATANGNGWL